MVIGKSQLEKLVTGVTFAVMALSTIAPVGAASPDTPREDVFSTTTTAPHRASSMPSLPQPVVRAPKPMVSKMSSPQEWFDAFDLYIAYYRANSEERILLNKPFNQEVERVTDFCKTLSGVAKKYRILAQKIRSLPLPDSTPGAKTLRDNMASWYDDTALVYEDMTRPRPPARTKEELNSMIKDVTDRSDSLKSTLEHLQQMDSNMRIHLGVNPPKYDDALNEYTRKSRPGGI